MAKQADKPNSKKTAAPKKAEAPKAEPAKVEAPKAEAPKAVEQNKPAPVAEAPAKAKKTIKDVKCKVVQNFGPLWIYTARFTGEKGEEKSYPENVAHVLRRQGLVI